MVAKNSTTTKSVRVQNGNGMPVRIFMECHHSCVRFNNGPRTIIPANSEGEITMRYSAAEIGHYNIEIKCIINECHCLNIPILVEVVAKYVEVNVRKVVFTSNDPKPKYVEVLNPLNAPVYYTWESQATCFSIEPKSGVIEPYTSYPFLVTYTPKSMGLALTHFILILENGFNLTLPISAIVEEPKVTLRNTHLAIESIPLNTPIKKRLFLRNYGYETITVAVSDPNPLKGVLVYPHYHLLHGKSDLPLTFEFNMKEFVKFSCDVTLMIQDFYDKTITLSGSVELPDISINPTVLNFGRIPVYASKLLSVCIENNSSTPTKLSFDFQLYPGFSIGDRETFSKKTDVILKKFESKSVFLRFYPIDIVSCNSHFPFTINDTICTNNSVLKLDTHSILLKSSSSFPLLKFSCLQFEFKFFPSDQYDSITSNNLDITNVCQNCVHFCLRTDDFGSHFSMDVINTNRVKIEKHEFSYVCYLEPNQTVTYRVRFHPESPGVYKINVPVFVRHEMDGTPFNYVNLNGFYPKPLFETSETFALLEPVPLGCFCTKLIEMKTLYHKPNCTINTQVEFYNLVVHFTEINHLGGADFEKNYKVIVTFSAHTPINKLERITFTCNCPCEKVVTLKLSSENSSITTHSFLKIHRFSDAVRVVPDMRPDDAYDQEPMLSKDIFLASLNTDIVSSSLISSQMNKFTFANNVFLNETTYPFFPDDEDNSDYAEYMRTTVSALEEWIYEQCFYCRHFYSIPDGIRMRNLEMKNHQNFALPLMVMLDNVARPFLESLNIDGKVPQEKMASIYYLYSIYSKILNGLENKGAHLVHVRPEYLLEYEDYVEYMEETCEPSQFEEPILGEDRFQKLSKQCWMDLVLQVFKILFLYRTRMPQKRRGAMRLDQKTSSKSLTKTTSWSFSKHFEQLQVPFSDFYCVEELMLLHWLEYHYNIQRVELWTKKTLKYRHIEHFDDDLKDGLVLAAVTAAHCPYLAENLQKLFVDADSYEKQFYNAARLIETWELIGVSFSILPKQIVKPNMIQMLLLVTYLFDYLPKLEPNHTVTINCDHTKSTDKTITIKNYSCHTIAYQIKLIGDNIKNIECDTKILIIEPKCEGSIIVTYHAKKLAHLHAIILFLGDTCDYNYAKSIAMDLECIPNIVPDIETKLVQCNIYEVFLAHLEIVSPYQETANYDIYYTQNMPDNVEHLHEKLHDYKRIRELKLPLEIFKQTGTFKTNSEGRQTIEFKCCPILPTVREYIGYFCNDDVGDFALKLVLDTDTKRIQYETISVQTPKDLKLTECICKKTKMKLGVKCPRELTMSLPCKNYLMWSAIQEMFRQSLDKDDVPFWDKYLKTTAGNNLLKYLFEEEKDIAPMAVRHLFDKKVTYRVKRDYDPSPTATLPKTITIDNVMIDGFLDVPIHIDVDKPEDFYFNMISVGKTEIRYYKVEFLP